MVFQDSERYNNVSRATRRLPGSSALAEASHFSKTGWASCREGEFALYALKLRNQPRNSRRSFLPHSYCGFRFANSWEVCAGLRQTQHRWSWGHWQEGAASGQQLERMNGVAPWKFLASDLNSGLLKLSDMVSYQKINRKKVPQTSFSNVTALSFIVIICFV